MPVLSSVHLQSMLREEPYVQGLASSFETGANIVKAVMGAAMFAIPHVFMKMGIFGGSVGPECMHTPVHTSRRVRSRSLTAGLRKVATPHHGRWAVGPGRVPCGVRRSRERWVLLASICADMFARSNHLVRNRSLVTVVLASLTAYSMLLLLEAKHLVASETMQQYIRYVDIARHAFGAPGATLLFVLSVFASLGVAAANLTFVGR